MRAALEDSIAGRGGCFLISGEPGIGKTRLADELAADAVSRGVRVAWGRCWEGGGAPAYWPWVEIVRALVLEPGRARQQQPAVPPEIGQLIPELAAETTQQQSSSDPEQGRFRLFDAVATLIKQVGRSTPVVLILDDLHEADRGSLELLKFVARGLADSRVVIVGTYRDAEVRRSSYLAESISEIVRHGHPMPLASLAENEVAQMIEHRAERSPSATFASELHRVTAGNPLFVDGVIRVLVAERKLGMAEHLDLSGFKLPEGVRGAIRKRLALLSAEARSALAVAAVIGQEFELVVLERVNEESAGTLAELMREAAEVGIVGATSRESYRFTHPLIREALYKDSTDADRARLHRAIAEALEDTHAANLTPHLAALAHHFHEAGVGEKAIDYSIRAGDAADGVFAHQEALDHYRVALALMEETSDNAEPRAELLERLAGVSRSIDEAEHISYLERALKLYENIGRTERVASLNITLGTRRATHTPALNVSRALEHLDRARAALDQKPSELARARLDIALSLTMERTLKTREGIDASSRAMSVAARVADQGLWASAGRSHAVHLIYAGRLAEGFDLLDRVWQVGDGLNHREVTFGASHSGTGFRGLLADPQDSLSWSERELSRPSTMRSPYFREQFSSLSSDSLALMGRLTEARHKLGEANDHRAAWIAYFEGRWEFAEQQWTLVADFFTTRGASAAGFGLFAFLSRARVLLRKYSAAEEMLEAGIETCRDDSLRTVEMFLRPELGLLLADLDRREEARVHLSRCREIAAAGEDWLGLAGHLARADAVVAAADGHFHEAVLQFEKAIATFKRYTLPWEEAETFLYWGRAANAAGDSRANEKFDAAIELYRHHGGGQRWIERVEAARKPAAALRSQESSFRPATFRKEGEFWTISYREATFRLKDVKGLAYIAFLLAHQGERIHVHELIARVDAVADAGPEATAATPREVAAIRDLGDAGVALDQHAQANYRRQLRELSEDLAEAQKLNDIGREESIRRELDFLTAELSAAVGIGGRDRKAASHVERARWMVSKNIRAGLEKIHHEDVTLGRYFATSIKTGYYCAYLPDPERAISWQL